MRHGIWFIICCFLVAPFANAQDQFKEIPPLSGRVIDQVGVLTGPDIEESEAILSSLESAKGAQGVVLIVPSTLPEQIEQYSIRVAEKWKLGRKGIDDGFILVIAVSDRAFRLEVAYGLEGVLTDAMSNRILTENLLPALQQQQYGRGIISTLQAVSSVIEGESLPSRTAPKDPQISIVLLVFLGLFLSALFSSLRGVGSLISAFIVVVVGTIFFTFFSGLIASFIVLFFGSTGVTSRNGYYIGRGGLGGLGGGGFGGGFSGGGGSFGGGGASGRW